MSNYSFKRQPHKMTKHTQTIRRQQPTNYLRVFEHFVRLELRLCSYCMTNLKLFLSFIVFNTPLYRDTHTCVRTSGGKKCSFFRKFVVLCFLVTAVLIFALLPYYRLNGEIYVPASNEQILKTKYIQIYQTIVLDFLHLAISHLKQIAWTQTFLPLQYFE